MCWVPGNSSVFYKVHALQPEEVETSVLSIQYTLFAEIMYNSYRECVSLYLLNNGARNIAFKVGQLTSLQIDYLI